MGYLLAINFQQYYTYNSPNKTIPFIFFNGCDIFPFDTVWGNNLKKTTVASSSDTVFEPCPDLQSRLGVTDFEF